MKKIYLIVGIAVFTGIGLLSLLLFQQRTPNNEATQINPTPSQGSRSRRMLPTLTPYPNVPAAVITPLISLLPYENELFIVEYLPTNQQFFVSIKDGDSEESYQSAINWLEQNGVPNPENNREVRFLFLKQF